MPFDESEEWSTFKSSKYSSARLFIARLESCLTIRDGLRLRFLEDVPDEESKDPAAVINSSALSPARFCIARLDSCFIIEGLAPDDERTELSLMSDRCECCASI